MIPTVEVNSEAQSSAALSLTAALIQKLILNNVLRKDEVIELYESLAEAKKAKAKLHASEIEAEAGALLSHLADRLREKL